MALYSHSKLGTFETCKFQYKCRYIDHIKVETDTIEKHLGKVVHDVLEKLYKDLLMGKMNSKEALIGSYEKLWERGWHDKIMIVKTEYDATHYWKRGERSISDYYDQYYPFSQGKTIGLERRVMFDLDKEGKHKIQGYIDRLVYNGDGVYEIHDYKTASSPPTDESLKEDRQLALYQIDVEDKFNDVSDVKLVWHYLTFGKEFSSKRTKEDLDALKLRTIALIEEIERTDDFQPKENPICPWCDYQFLCPVRKHLVKVQTLTVEDYLKDDGVKLVDRYADLSEKESLIRKELEILKDAIFQYAGREGFDALMGKSHVLKLSTDEYFHFPGTDLKEKPLREEMIRILKENGKYEEVSTIDTRALGRVLKAEKWGRELLEKIKEFASKEVTRRISKSKIKEREN